jgi:hypothetical protein
MRKKWDVVVALFALAALAPSASQGPELKSVMREKLVYAQKLLEAVVTSDWLSLETNSRQLEQLTNDPRWTVLKYPEYAQHSGAFVRAVRLLHTAAAQRDLDRAPKAFTEVTLRCVECHRYLGRARVAVEIDTKRFAEP